jgi:hypothetical protein
MKQLFKTTLLAATIAAACGSAVAGDVTVVKQVHSLEGLAGVTANQTSNLISYKLGAAYREGDKITLTFPTGAIDANSTSFASVINVLPINHADATKAIAGITLGLLNSTAESVTYRVTKLTLPNDAGTPAVEWQNGSTLGAVVGTVAAPLTVGYKAAAVKAASVTVTVSSQTSAGDVLDSSGTRTGTIAEAKSQFGTAAVSQKFDAVIDVAAARKAFVGVAWDEMAYTVTTPTTTGWLNMATVNTTGVNVRGEKGKLPGVKVTDFRSGGTNTFTEADSLLAIAYTGMVTNDTIRFTPPTGANAILLETQKFTADFAYNYSSAGAVAGVHSFGGVVHNAGEWTLNGATVNIPYMPYSPNASQIIYVTNTGAQAGEILATAYDEAGHVLTLGNIGIAKANSVTKIADQVRKALEDQGFTGGKVSITFTVNAPDDNITIYASYNIGNADRGFVNTDQYKGYNP